jgi:hypothetical protein
MEINMKKYGAIWLALILLFSIRVKAQSYQNEAGDVINPRWYLSVGGYFPQLNTSLRVDSERGLGTEISLEDDFKLESQVSAVRFSANYRIKERSQLVFSFTNINRQKSFRLSKDIRFGDTTFYANAQADFEFDVYHYALTWRYSFFNETNWNAGLSLGLRGVQVGTSLQASLNSRSYEQSFSSVAPTLLVGLHGSGYLTPRLLARYSFEYFQITIWGMQANAIETQASLQYYITKNIGLGCGYATSNYGVKDIPLADFTGKFNFSFAGFTLFATARL